MSCYICAPATFDAIAAHLTAHPAQMPAGYTDPAQVALALYRLNLTAYAGRYNEDTSDQIDLYQPATVPTPDPIALGEETARLEYQCAEDLAVDAPLFAWLQQFAQQADRSAKAEEERQRRERQRELEAAGPAEYVSMTDTAKTIRRELRAAFPGVKFWVRSKSGISIVWIDGPTRAEVEAIAGKYESRGFDGMQDLSYYIDHWITPDGQISVCTTGNPYAKVSSYPKPHPQARRVSFSTGYMSIERNYSPEWYEAQVARIAADLGHPAPPIARSSLWVSNSNQIPTAVMDWRDYTTEEWLVREIQTEIQNTSALTPLPQAETPAQADPSAPDVEITHDRDWTWVKFADKPGQAILDALDALGLRWSKKRAAWYATQPIPTETLTAIWAS